VEINGVIAKELLLSEPAALLIIRVGKKWKRVSIPKAR
jgi:hypothetical protein